MKGQAKKNQAEQPPSTLGGEAEKRDSGGQAADSTGTGEKGVVPRAHGNGSEGSGSYSNNQKLLIGLAAAILVILIAGSSFALGFAMGNQSAGISTLVGERRGGMPPEGGPPGPGGERGPRMPEGAEEGARPDRQNPKEQVQEQLNDENTELIEGEVASIDGTIVTVQGFGGAESVALTGETRFLGAGGGEIGGGDISQLTSGARVTMLIRKAEDGSLEAVAVRVKEGP
ncbi:MAG: hypothetical protein KKB90_12335 [Actinobacteria bacterium]|nr:hypothetical protein [Actinomycetota bacterium]MCG2817578.1 hypothetical protein [Actinomycetes bacterium]MBU4219734.1 hypothetical protein [Actinomycetota bacterium]MBU4357640.1 hypothetical protein [Actinomycetota bacterium]MBU4392834.1 hypothetical protein [Actinomycetota bacterium]